MNALRFTQMYEDSLLSDDYEVSAELSVNSEISLDTSSVYDGSSSYISTDSQLNYETISEKLDVIHSDLQHIGQGVDHIFVCALFLVAVKAVWTVFNNWYFGGV